MDEARLHAVTEKVKHVDATTWRQGGAYRSLWTLATASVTVFMIATDGTRATLQAWLRRFTGVLVSDRGTQFDFWVVTRRQICWAHLIRKFAALGERSGRPGEIGRELLGWSRVMLHAYHRVRDRTASRAELRRIMTNVRALMEQLLEEGAALPVKGLRGACKNILEHREAMWRFVIDPAVEPTNNHAERELRGLVCWRKSSGGSQSEREHSSSTESLDLQCLRWKPWESRTSPQRLLCLRPGLNPTPSWGSDHHPDHRVFQSFLTCGHSSTPPRASPVTRSTSNL